MVNGLDISEARVLSHAGPPLSTRNHAVVNWAGENSAGKFDSGKLLVKSKVPPIVSLPISSAIAESLKQKACPVSEWRLHAKTEVDRNIRQRSYLINKRDQGNQGFPGLP